MNKPLKIGMIAPLSERVPPRMYGGTERVVSWLTEKLVEDGHDVTLFASGDSITSAHLVPGAERSLRLDKNLRNPMVLHILMLSQIFDRLQDKFDIIHCHIDYLSFPYIRACKTPVVITMHGRLDYPEYMQILHYFQDLNYVSISNAQRRPVPKINWLDTIHHGMPKNILQYIAEPEDYFLFLGRITEEKRPDIAIELAKKCEVKLKIAAKVDKVDVDYFEHKIKPLLDHPLIDFVGEVNDRQKQNLLGKAKALLNTIDWPEPFGLVMIESLACGTPVITKRCGSVSELIDHGHTGYICNSEEEFIEAISNVDDINRKNCRDIFEQRFTNEQMTQNYVSVYRQLLR